MIDLICKDGTFTVNNDESLFFKNLPVKRVMRVPFHKEDVMKAIAHDVSSITLDVFIKLDRITYTIWKFFEAELPFSNGEALVELCDKTNNFPLINFFLDHQYKYHIDCDNADIELCIACLLRVSIYRGEIDVDNMINTVSLLLHKINNCVGSHTISKLWEYALHVYDKENKTTFFPFLKHKIGFCYYTLAKRIIDNIDKSLINRLIDEGIDVSLLIEHIISLQNGMVFV